MLLAVRLSLLATYAVVGCRAGAASSLVRQDIPEAEILHRAGVSSADWLLTYNRVNLPSRLRVCTSLFA